MKNKYLIIFFTAVMLTGFLFIGPSSIADLPTPEMKIFDENFKLEKTVKIDGMSGYNLAVCDLGGDGVDEIILAPTRGHAPEVKIYRGSGTLITSFLAYQENFHGGVEVACADLDGDGTAEIITGTGKTGGPHVRIFDGFGRTKFHLGFFAYDMSERNGVKVAAGDTDGDGVSEIITSSYINGKHHVKVFSDLGLNLIKNIFPLDWQGENLLNIASADIGGDGRDEILVGASYGNNPVVQIYSADGLLLNDFEAYVSGFQGGVNLASIDKGQDGKDEILTGAGYLGGPHIRVLNPYGQEKGRRAFFAYNGIYKGGVSVAAGDIDGDGRQETVTTLDRWPEGDMLTDKYVLIDISDQTMTNYYYGYPIGTYMVSSGTWSMPTPLGEFAVIAKSEEAYSARYGLYMPYWMQFTYQGHGMHGLPFWKYSWGVVYEGVDHLGLRVSHGCVRLSVENAKMLYEWIPIGMKVVIQD